ncbi:Ser/Thr protein phosphatase superfamily [Cercophora newfieldiana]|uniref:Ser/Thr protein phosphatase superfamily n=1 Tax=Cercophora newfieldiana TaxID=92897 RepID=A0AA39Y6C8_9PEZI|nr:Ser/Thr protein phosphatase superfamily [Cercophora newfieldiana]
MPALQIVSDLHLENLSRYGQIKIAPKAPYLALLGDIGCIQQDAKKGIFRAMIFRLLKQNNAIFYVPGNHEPYNTTWTAVEEWLKKTEEVARSKSANGEMIGDFIPMSKNRFDFDDNFTILGCTLFSEVPEERQKTVEKEVNDFHKIKTWSVKDHVMCHRRHVHWLNSEVQKAEEEGRKVMTLTHHSPTLDDRAVEEMHRNDVLLSAFSTDLSAELCWTSTAVKLWAFGHTHYNCDFLDEFGERVVTNQKGYVMVGNSNGWDPDKVIEV